MQVLVAFISVLLLTTAQAADDSQDEWIDTAVNAVLSSYDRESVLVVGELHGTRETPALVSALVRRLAQDTTVVLGLEIPRQEQVRIDEFLHSDGGAEASAKLLAGDFWQPVPEYSDGRRSEAMAALLGTIREARHSGAAVGVVTLDDADFSVGRRQGMSTRIAELDGNPDYELAVVLIGNYHARLTPPSRTFSDGEVLTEPPLPTAARIADVPLTSVNVTACSGVFWACVSPGSCGPVELPSQCPAAAYPLVEDLDPGRHGYHLGVTLETLTPSRPASSSGMRGSVLPVTPAEFPSRP